MPKIDDFFKKLEDEERRMKQGTSTTNTANQVKGRGGRGGRGGGRGGRGGSQTSGSQSRCTLCGVNHSSDDECPHKDWDCHACNKKGHGSKNCDYVTKAAKEKAAKKGKGKAKESKSKDDDSEDDKKNVTMATR